MTSHFVVNFHEHPSVGLSETNTRLGIDLSVLLPVGTEAMHLAIHLGRERPDAFVPFMAGDFPGNVRELGNILDHASVLSPGAMAEFGHLPDTPRGRREARAEAPPNYQEQGWRPSSRIRRSFRRCRPGPASRPN